MRKIFEFAMSFFPPTKKESTPPAQSRVIFWNVATGSGNVTTRILEVSYA